MFDQQIGRIGVVDIAQMLDSHAEYWSGYKWLFLGGLPAN